MNHMLFSLLLSINLKESNLNFEHLKQNHSKKKRE